jgi:hypothetical protein
MRYLLKRQLRNAVSSLSSCALVAISVLGCGPSHGNEVPQCDDPAVKEVVLRRFVIFREKLSDSLRAMKSDASDSAIRILSMIQTDIGRIRQQNYDKGNNIRYCAGTLMDKGLPALTPEQTSLYSTALFAAQMHSGQSHPGDCGDDRGGTTYYKIERPLRSDNEFVVSWRCRPW